MVDPFVAVVLLVDALSPVHRLGVGQDREVGAAVLLA
jgi:hypothetical protein